MKDINEMFLGELFEYRSILINRNGDKDLIEKITLLIENFSCMM